MKAKQTIGLLLLVSSILIPPAAAQAQRPDQGDFKAQFLRLCDLASAELNKDYSPFVEADRHAVKPKTHHVPFFEDSHAVRALAVAYDMTGKREYLDACRRWSDRMIDYQNQMVPKGAYYLNYFRKPGQTGEMWFVSDASSEAMGILATAVRCTQPADRDRYLNSVKLYADVVMRDRVGKNGGIIEALWGSFRDEWWCSTATFGSLALLLYQETGDERYLKVGLGARLDDRTRLLRCESDRFQRAAFRRGLLRFSVVRDGHEILAGRLGKTEGGPGTDRRGIRWMAANQAGRGAKPSWDYFNDGHTDMAAMPFLMYSFAHQLPEYRDLTPAADQELGYLGGLLFSKGDPQVSRLVVWELTSWGMMSYAEKLSPGSLFRSSRPATPGANP